jgi:hypothetical protein
MFWEHGLHRVPNGLVMGRVIDKHPTKLRMFIGIWANNFEFEYPSPGS